MSQKSIIIASSKHINLRDKLLSDLDFLVFVETRGQWRDYDAPWEGIRNSITPEEERKYREDFLAKMEDERPVPRKTAVIATTEGKPIGIVTRYTQHVHEKVWFIGIDIFEDKYLNRGFGTEAIRLWVDYLFGNSDIHRISLDTWSFNHRMIRVAQKLGFAYEGAQREMQQWQGEWLDLLHFGMLRSEWDTFKHP
jgi:RimJ/RimL family protein N-acetyltransferase